jgi:hypothetical protein
MTDIKVVEGWTAALDFQLMADGVAQNLTGMTVTLELRDRAGLVINTTGNVSVVDAPTGKVRYSADSGDLVAANGPYRARWKVVDGASKVSYFPSGEHDVWKIFTV